MFTDVGRGSEWRTRWITAILSSGRSASRVLKLVVCRVPVEDLIVTGRSAQGQDLPASGRNRSVLALV